MAQDVSGAPAAPQFTIGNVFGTSFAVLMRNIVPFGILALVLGLLEVLAALAGTFIVSQGIAGATSDSTRIALSVLFGVGLFLVSMAISNLLTAAVTYGVFQDLRGQRAGIGDCLTRGLASILPVVIATLLFSLLLGVGFILLVVPGILVGLAFWLYVPAIVVEKRSIGQSFSRSAQLTKGRRWTAFGLWLVFTIASQIVSNVLDNVSRAAGGELVWVVAYVWQAATTAFSAVMIAVSYYYLRVEKEGVGIDEIAAVFD